MIFFLVILLPLVLGSHIVQFKKNVTPSQMSDHVNLVAYRSSVNFLQSHKPAFSTPSLFQVGDLSGYSGSFTKDEVDFIKQDPIVELIETDNIVHTMISQTPADWGLSRVSHHGLGSRKDRKTFEYIKGDGTGVTVFIVDTGVFVEHNDFEGRATFGTSIPKGSKTDRQGHGTFCCSLVGGKVYGVAKNASLVAVKVLGDNGSGTLSDVIKGIEWVVEQDVPNKVISMSLGGGTSAILNNVANSAVDSGVVVVVAAGNEAQDACDVSPAGAEKVITVGATTKDDTLAYFSNVGTCVDVLSPGFNILGAYIGGADAKTTMSGTSMACPLTAGVVASIWSRNLGLTVKEVKEMLISSTTPDVIQDLDAETPNKLVYNSPTQKMDLRFAIQTIPELVFIGAH